MVRKLCFIFFIFYSRVAFEGIYLKKKSECNKTNVIVIKSILDLWVYLKLCCFIIYYGLGIEKKINLELINLTHNLIKI
jgi:hypothetical protein